MSDTHTGSGQHDPSQHDPIRMAEEVKLAEEKAVAELHAKMKLDGLELVDSGAITVGLYEVDGGTLYVAATRGESGRYMSVTLTFAAGKGGGPHDTSGQHDTSGGSQHPIRDALRGGGRR